MPFGFELPFRLGRRPPQRAYAVTLPREAAPSLRLRRATPRTIAPPISGLLVVTADNRPQDPRAWQNEPGPGAGESLELGVVKRRIAEMESVPRIEIPAA